MITTGLAGNFRGAIFSWISWFEACGQKFYPQILEPRLFMKYVQTLPQNENTHLLKILPLENYLLYGIILTSEYIVFKMSQVVP